VKKEMDLQGSTQTKNIFSYVPNCLAPLWISDYRIHFSRDSSRKGVWMHKKLLTIWLVTQLYVYSIHIPQRSMW